MIDKKYLLNSKQMARFVADGMLRFDALIPDDINQAAIEEFTSNTPLGARTGRPLHECFAESKGVGRLLAMPEVQGAIQSLVGQFPRYDHHAVHIVGPRNPNAQAWHADAIIDLRTHFDIQFYYFPHDVTADMGGTKILPGSHLRAINVTEISRYHHITGQINTVCKGGTIVFVHHGIWHGARPNLTDKTRYMFKLRLNPMFKQHRLWNTDDIDDPEVSRNLGRMQPWYGSPDGRLEIVNRIHLWRYLTGDPAFDLQFWMRRLENTPETIYPAESR